MNLMGYYTLQKFQLLSTSFPLFAILRWIENVPIMPIVSRQQKKVAWLHESLMKIKLYPSSCNLVQQGGQTQQHCTMCLKCCIRLTRAWEPKNDLARVAFAHKHGVLILVRGLSGVRFDSVCNHTSDYKIGRPRTGSPICLSRLCRITDWHRTTRSPLTN